MAIYNSWLSCYWDYSQFFVLLVIISFKRRKQTEQTTTTKTHLKKDKETTDDDKVSNDPIKAEKQKAKQSEDEKDKDAIHSQAPKIDVMSEDFHKSFMQKDTRDSYMGIKPGMTRAEVEKDMADPIVFFTKWAWIIYIIYGDLAVVYELKGNTEVVRGIGVSPSNVDEQTFISKYSDYEKIMIFGSYIYNTVKNNGFEILVTTKTIKLL